MSKGTLYKRRDGRWEYRVYHGKKDGKRLFKSFYGRTPGEAVRRKEQFSRRCEEATAITEMTVRELLDEWLKVVSPNVKESTAANYHMKAHKHLIPAFGDIHCCDLTPGRVCGFIDAKMKAGLSARYLSDILGMLRSVYRYAARVYHIKNMTEGIMLPKKQRPDVRMPDRDQRERIGCYLSEHPSVTAVGISLSANMGLRIGEVCALQWSDIDLKKRTLTVSRTIQRIQCTEGTARTKLLISEPKSGSSKRTIPIPACLMELLKKYRDSGDIYVVSGKKDPIEPRTMQYRFANILMRAGLPSFHYHSLRHLFATRCAQSGADIKTLSEILGHSSVKITLDSYIHSDMERKRECMELPGSCL